MDKVYNHTKLHNIICTNELARKLQGTGMIRIIIVLSQHFYVYLEECLDELLRNKWLQLL